MKKKFTYGLFLTAVLVVAIICACSEKIVNDNTGDVETKFRIQVGHSSGFEAIDQFLLTVTAADFEPIEAVLSLIDGYLVYQSGGDIIDNVLEIPIGRNRLFTIEAYDTQAIGGPLLVYLGQQAYDIFPGVPVTLTIVLEPMVPMIRVSPRYQTQEPLESFAVAVEAYNMPPMYSFNVELDFVDFELFGDSAKLGAGMAERVNGLSYNIVNVDGAYYDISVDGGDNNTTSLVDARGYAELAKIYFSAPYLESTNPNYKTDLNVRVGRDLLYDLGGNIVFDSTVYWDGGQVDVNVDFGTDPILTFPDPDLELAVREYSGVNIGDIHLSDVFAIEQMTWDPHDILDLTGINQLPNLKLFSASSCYGDVCLSDISGIAGCPELEYLDLSLNEIADISPLADVRTLQHIDFSQNLVDDISVLQDFPNLSYVDLGFTPITDIQPLIDNMNFGDGDTLNIVCTGVDVSQVTTLQNRGVLVLFGCK